MEVKLAQYRGFCFGVEDAVDMAEAALKSRGAGNVVALGPVIHNPQVVRRLEEAGLDQSGDLDTIEPGKSVLFRSHGARPETYEQARSRGLNIIDATCILVKKAQDAVRQLHEEGYHVVMIGDRDHPEVKGVIGYAPQVTIVDEHSDLEAVLPFRDRIGIVQQTTLSPEFAAEMMRRILERPFREVKIVNTLCLEVVHRQEAAVALCDEVDVMFVIGGRHSANTAEMVRLCRQTGRETHHVETWEDVSADMLLGKKVAGVTAGASTPEWIISEFVERLRAS